jgi:hypothetical protein
LILTNKSDIHTAGGERSTLRSPSETIFEDPCVKVVLSRFGETEIRSCNALEYVVVVLRGAEDAWGWVRDIPEGKSAGAT